MQDTVPQLVLFKVDAARSGPSSDPPTHIAVPMENDSYSRYGFARHQSRLTGEGLFSYYKHDTQSDFLYTPAPKKEILINSNLLTTVPPNLFCVDITAL
jgi:hypothetical protein